MAYVPWTNQHRALGYGSAELGEVMTLSTDNTTVTTKKAVNGAVVLAPGTSLAAAVTHVAVIHPAIGKVVG